MDTLLLITTLDDISFPLFFTQSIRQKINITPLLLTENTADFINTIKSQTFKWTYLRDPFNSNLTNSDIDIKLNTIFKYSSNTIFIDNLSTPTDLYFEDKWIQYQLLKSFMPKTKLCLDPTLINFETQFVKKRISSRAKGIIFDTKKIKTPHDYIIQEKLDIETEYRINIIANNILEPANIKKSKTSTTKVKFTQTVPVDPQLKDYAHQINSLLDFDFIGLDIARLKDGSLKLIEVNRSPQFRAVYRDTNTNLAETLISHLTNQ